MASLILGAGVLTYNKIKTTREKRRAKKENDATRFAELEKETAERIAQPQPGSYREKAPGYPNGPPGDHAERKEKIQAGGVGRRSEEGASESEEEIPRTAQSQQNANGRPPIYNDLVMEDKKKGKKNGLRGKMFGRKGRDEDDGIVR